MAGKRGRGKRDEEMALGGRARGTARGTARGSAAAPSVPGVSKATVGSLSVPGVTAGRKAKGTIWNPATGAWTPAPSPARAVLGPGAIRPKPPGTKPGFFIRPPGPK